MLSFSTGLIFIHVQKHMHFNFVCPTVSVDKTSPMGEPMALCSIFMNHSQFSSVSPSAGRLLGGAPVGVDGAGVGRCGRVAALALASPSAREAAAGCVGSCCWQRRRHGAARPHRRARARGRGGEDRWRRPLGIGSRRRCLHRRARVRLLMAASGPAAGHVAERGGW